MLEHRRFAASFVVGSVLTLCLPALAQEPVSGPGGASGAQAAPWRPPQTMKEVLTQTYWNAEARGALLAIGAENNRPWMPKREPGDDFTPIRPPQPLSPPDRNGYQIDAVAPYFGDRTVRLPSLTVVAPAEMTLLNNELKGKPDPFAGMRSDEKTPLLLATLNPAQWKALGSVGGLGMGDLDEAQKTLFLSLLPNPMRIQQAQAEPGGGYSLRDGPDNKPVVLAGAERSGVRLRLTRSVQLIIPSADLKGYGTYVSMRLPETKYLSIANRDWYQKPEAFGTKVKAEFPSKLKPGHLNFDASTLSVTVSLAGVKTVAELVKRVHEATGLELYADGRVGVLSVTVLGDTSPVRAGDLLKALCWAVTGTWRQVGPAFVLTHDVEGIAQSRARILAWMEQGQRERDALRNRAFKNLRNQQPLQYLSFGANDPLALTPAMMTKVEEAWTKPEARWMGAILPTSELPGAMQQLARNALEQYNKQGNQAQTRPLSQDRVRINVQTRLLCLLPGNAGEADLNFGQMNASQLLPAPDRDDAKYINTPVALPTTTGGVTLLWDVTDKAELQSVFAAAKARGITHVWLNLPLDEAIDKSVLTAALEAAKPHGIAVSPVVRLWEVPPQKGATAADRDTNTLGETSGAWAARRLALPENYSGSNASMRDIGDYLRPDAPGVVARIKRRLLALAQLPGVTSIVLTHTLPPGYTTPEGGEEWENDTTATEMGFTPDARLAFLRQTGSDPVDLWRGYSETDWTLPFFGESRPRYIQKADGIWGPDPNAKNPRAEWNKARYTRAANALAELYRAFHAEQPRTSLILHDIRQFFYGWFGTWDGPEKLPVLASNSVVYSDEGAGPQAAILKAARNASKTVWYVLLGRHVMNKTPEWADPDPIVPGSPQAFRRMLNAQLEQLKKDGMDKAWDGLVLDMSMVPAANLLGFLRDTETATKSAAN